MTDRLQRISDIGVSLWLDDLSRTRLTSGGLAKLVDNDHVVGVTTNPSIFSKAIGSVEGYQDQIDALASRGAGVDEVVRTLTTDDVRAACDVLRPIYDRTDGEDGRVSIEVDPRLAAQTQPTIDAAKRLWSIVDRPNAMIKIPATPEGLPAITQAIGAGISVNVTLIFSVDQYRDVVRAYWDGLDLARANGIDLATIRSVASFFVSRIDVLLDPKLAAIGTPAARALQAKVAIANARLAYEAFEKSLATDRWKALAAAGATAQRPLWASTSVKDPKLPPTLYVDELAVDRTVNTMPESTLRAVAEGSTQTGDAVRPNYADAHRVFDQLPGLGIDFAQVSDQLLREGVDKFATSWQELLGSVRGALASA